MFSFMIMISKLGSIEQIIWSEPDSIVTGNAISIFELFSRDGKAVLLRAMKKSALRDDAFICDSSIRLRDQSSNMVLFIVSVDSRFLVFAAEEKMFRADESSTAYQNIILLFMNIMKNSGNGKVFGNASPANIQVDMIQTLLNELKSRKRLLEETNTQMNIINQDLNNRLVKDALTGLVSRYQYRTEIEFAIGKDPGKYGVFVFIDIDDFKAVNDKYGHAVGDRYLVEFSERLKQMPTEDMIRMRISGDEFGLFVSGLDAVSSQVMEEIWRKIKHHVLSTPIEVNGHRLPISISAGMSVYGVDTNEIYELIENADFAMFSAKRRGKNRYSIFDKATHAR